jgi:hypothetical protein
MTRSQSRCGAVLILAGMLFAAGTLTGCGVSIPFSVTVPLNLGTGFSLGDFGSLAAGQEIPSDTGALSVPLCSLPSTDDIMSAINQSSLGFLASLFTLTGVHLLDITLTPTAGNFQSFTSINAQLKPAPVDGEEQPAVDLGTAADANGLGSPVILQPVTPPDFLSIIDTEPVNPPTDCPKLEVNVAGHVPETNPVWGIAVTVKVSGEIGL